MSELWVWPWLRFLSRHGASQDGQQRHRTLPSRAIDIRLEYGHMYGGLLAEYAHVWN